MPECGEEYAASEIESKVTSLALLPLENAEKEESLEYLSDGI
jgi:TolB-like protein